MVAGLGTQEALLILNIYEIWSITLFMTDFESYSKILLLVLRGVTKGREGGGVDERWNEERNVASVSSERKLSRKNAEKFLTYFAKLFGEISTFFLWKECKKYFRRNKKFSLKIYIDTFPLAGKPRFVADRKEIIMIYKNFLIVFLLT